ncbi:MAG: S9 family peptidase [Rikenellaceae bacterium]
MKKIILLMALFALGACVGSSDSTKPLKIDNSLTAEEREAGVLTPEVMWKMSRIGAPQLSPDGAKMLYTCSRYDMTQNRGITQIMLQSTKLESPKALTDNTASCSSAQWSADGSKIYFLTSRSGSSQVWVMNSDGTNQEQFSDIEGDIEGFGVAPSGERLFYVKKVKSAKRLSKDIYTDMPNSKARIYDDLMARHWDYWDEGEYSHIFVAEILGNKVDEGVDIIGAESAWDAPLAPYFDMSEIAWSNSGKLLAYTCKPLTGTEYAQSTDSDIFVYNVESGQFTNICKNGKTADVEMVGYDKYPQFSPSDDKLAFISQRRAGNESDKQRLFIYDFESEEVRDLTASFDNNTMSAMWSGDDTLLFISPIEATHQVCRVDLNGNVKVITSGDHDINALSIGGTKGVAALTTISSATELYDVDLTSGSLRQITKSNQEIYDNITMGEVEERWVTTTDGKKMLTWMILPPNFDKSKSYPTLLYCQGGPQSVVSQFWSYRWNFQLMAAQGYIVVAPNRRGLPSFGQEWLDQISGDYSGQNIQDYLSAIDDVAKEPWVDSQRLGCVGASYGGYSVFYLAGHHEGRFKAFIAHCGIFNFTSMYGETEELFFLNNDYGGNYWDRDNATAQRSYANSPHKAVKNWDTPILIYTGENDFRIPYTQSLQAFTAARLLGVPSRLVCFEDEGHQVFKPQNSLVWNREFFGWLEKYL